MKKGIIIASLILFIVLGYAAAGPYFTLSSIKTGILEQDSETLSENIEFPTLRQNLKDQLNLVMMKSVATELEDNPFAAIAAALVTKMVDGVVDSFVTPSGLAALMEGKSPSINKNKPSTSRPSKDDLFKNARYSYDSMSKFSIWVPSGGKEEARFVLQRYGLSWKLVNIVIPIDKQLYATMHSSAIDKNRHIEGVYHQHNDSSDYEILDTFTVELASTGESKYLQTDISLKVSDQLARIKIRSHLPEIRDKLLQLLSRKHANEIQTVEGKELLEREIQHAINKVINAHEQNGVSRVLFTSFLIL